MYNYHTYIQHEVKLLHVYTLYAAPIMLSTSIVIVDWTFVDSLLFIVIIIINIIVPLSGSLGVLLLLLTLRITIVTARIARTKTNSAPDAEHVPATYTGNRLREYNVRKY